MPDHVEHRQPQFGRGAAAVPAAGLTLVHGWRLWFAVCLAAVLLMLSACGQQQLYTNLAESEANELIAALQSADIDAAKVDQGKEKWAVEVSQGEFARAVAVLRSQGLPKPQFETLGVVFKKSGFGDNTTEAQARFIHARQQEMMQALRKIDGVVDASVELSIPAKDRLVENPVAPTASVLIKYRPGTNLPSRAGDIKGLVANGVEGLSYDRVVVSMYRAEEATPSAERSSAMGWLPLLMIPVALLLGIAGFIGYRRQNRSRALVRPER